MTSILTNNGAIVALQTLKNTNKMLGMTQREISTGKKINHASDGSAIWAVAKTMESDRNAFKTVQQGLNVAAKVVSTAVEGATGIVDDLNVIKDRLSASSSSSQDPEKNWDEIKELIDGIKAKINGAQINGVNLLNKQGTGDGASGAEKGKYTVLASLDRSYGKVQTSHTEITVESVDLKTAIADVLDSWTAPTDAAQAKALISGQSYVEYEEYKVDFDRYGELSTGKTAYGSNGTSDRTKEEEAERNALIEKHGGAAKADAKGARTGGTDASTTGTLDAGLTGANKIASGDYATANSGSTTGLESTYATYSTDYDDYHRITALDVNARSEADVTKLNTIVDKYDGGTATFTAGTVGTAATPAVAESVPAALATEVNKTDHDTSVASAKATAAQSVEALIDLATKAGAKLGAKQHRIESQEETVGRIKDNLTSGIGALVDSDLEEASARLQALQTQQQLGIQSLSIANQAPGAVLSLFR